MTTVNGIHQLPCGCTVIVYRAPTSLTVDRHKRHCPKGTKK